MAELLGFSDRDVAKMDGRQLHPTRAPDRVWRYDLAEVRAVLDKRGPSTHVEVPEPDGETTAAVFTLFAARRPLTKVVVATKQPARVVSHLRALYDDMRGSLTIPGSVLAELRELLRSELKQPSDLAPAIRAAFELRLEEGRADALDFGQVLDPSTGQLRPVTAQKDSAQSDEVAATTEKGATP
ncbi:MAG: hypothetical protein SFX73_08500 [Kofleriaceae bacterium]|nr:hypothetical protein [Kofleriaceae bacterium]